MPFRSLPFYLIDPAFSSREIRDEIEPSVNEWLDYHQLEDGTQLFHYTNLDGLKGILKSRALWLSHISSLNDPIEIEHGQQIIAEIINQAIDDEENELIELFYRQLLIQVNAFGNTLFIPFIACFCSDGDLLSQWRAYADQGGGYSIGFNFTDSVRVKSESEDFEEVDEGYFPYLRKVIYEREEKEHFVNNFLENAVRGLNSALEGPIGRRFEDDLTYPVSVMAGQAANLILDMLLSFKHPAFKEEKEWRLIRVKARHEEADLFQFREDSHGLLPYLSTSIYSQDNENYKFPIQSINYGPALDSNRTSPSLELFVNHSATLDHEIDIDPVHVTIKGTNYNLR